MVLVVSHKDWAFVPLLLTHGGKTEQHWISQMFQILQWSQYLLQSKVQIPVQSIHGASQTDFIPNVRKLKFPQLQLLLGFSLLSCLHLLVSPHPWLITLLTSTTLLFLNLLHRVTKALLLLSLPLFLLHISIECPLCVMQQVQSTQGCRGQVALSSHGALQYWGLN